jgi:thioredoxin 1
MMPNAIDAGAKRSAIETATGETFASLVLEGRGPIVVEFMSYGCEHCRVLEPILERAAEGLKTTERVFRVNVAVEADLAERYEIRGTPTLVAFENGREVGRVEGPHPTLSSVTSALTKPFAV